jgi:hypothetical protein
VNRPQQKSEPFDGSVEPLRGSTSSHIALIGNR